MLIAHISDTHLGYVQYGLKEREEDFYKAFEQCIDKIIDLGCEVLIHTGDLFEKNNPSNKARLFVKEQFKRLLENGVKIFIIPGNHDNPPSRYDPYPPHILYDVHLLGLKRFYYEYKDLLIFGLPHLPKTYNKQLKMFLRQIERLNKNRKKYRSILMLHQIIDKYFPYDYELTISDLPKGIDYYAMGHLHRNIVDRIDDSILCYPGPIETYRIDEAFFDKGFYVIDIDSLEIKRIKIKTRRFIVETIDEKDYKEKILRIKPFAKESVVHLNIRVSEFLYKKVMDFISNVLDDCFYLKVEKEISKYDSKKLKAKSLRDMIKEYLYPFTEEFKRYGYSEEDLVDFTMDVLKYLGSGDFEKAERIVENFYRDFKNRVMRYVG